ncbi:folylpolyglutamate synthase, mitochondrial-like [Galendromus occidentalis]|uniref:Folylpolyglutamate synthase n=1 Tax=Galendromus occidentalis TaxID=34638 RepID=A0AAJ6VVD3_9ACAR|nr:folylpolyglutamate synthase, mitochondrial-like [Galendromus occidentalis]
MALSPNAVCGSCAMPLMQGHHNSLRFVRMLQRRLESSGLRTTPVVVSSRGYEEAVSQLNKLQSNVQAIEESVKLRQTTAPLTYTKCSNYLHALGIEQKQLTAMRVVHVSGTKGKGSTCAYTESILRSYGYKTGFYSSPHLVAVRERIRINGKPISKAIFAKHFWHTFDILTDFEQRSGEKVPMYFAFLTMMAFRVFMHEKVHVAVVEVGIGGEYDWTNVVDQPSVVGITSLGLDHTRLLGDTIEQIAWHKGGIMKFLVPAFTVTQPASAMEVLQKKAIERRCHLYCVPSLHLYDTKETFVKLGIPGKVQMENASLAIQLAHFWIKKNDPLRFPHVEWGVTPREDVWNFSYAETDRTLARPFALPKATMEGLTQCRWPGRCQLLVQGNTSYFLDGAHTLESMEECARWFVKCHKTASKRYKILVFHCTGDRNNQTLLSHLGGSEFDCAIFTPTRTHIESSISSDNSNFTVNIEKERMKCLDDEQVFLKLVRERPVQTNVVSCVAEAVHLIRMISKEKLEKSIKVSALVTGSLHLVGNTLSIIDPDSE